MYILNYNQPYTFILSPEKVWIKSSRCFDPSGTMYYMFMCLDLFCHAGFGLERQICQGTDFHHSAVLIKWRKLKVWTFILQSACGPRVDTSWHFTGSKDQITGCATLTLLLHCYIIQQLWLWSSTVSSVEHTELDQTVQLYAEWKQVGLFLSSARIPPPRLYLVRCDAQVIN